MNVENALTIYKEQNPEAADLIYNYIRDLHHKNVLCLGTDEAFALRNESGNIVAFKQAVTLSAHNGGLIAPVPGGPHVVSAQGYEIWAEAAGASCIFPKEVLVGGEWKPNPYAEKDENKRLVAVHARAIAFRFSSKGIPQVSDWTTIFDTPAYRLIDLLGKAKKLPQAFRLLPAGQEPESEGTWAKYIFDESANLFVNTSHPEAMTWYAQILNREKKAMDFAQTFAKRNAMKHLSGIQKAPDGAPHWVVPVICWRPTNGSIIKWDATEYSNLQDRVVSMIQGDTGSFQAQIEVKKGVECVSDDDNHKGLEAEVDPEDAPETETVINVTPEPEEKKLSPDDIKAINNAMLTRDNFPDEFQAACKKLKLSPDTGENARAIMKAVNEIIDSQMEA